MALKEQTILKSVVVDYEVGSVNVVHLQQIIKDGEIVSSIPHREAFGLTDFDQLTKKHPDLADRYGKGVLGWTEKASKDAREARERERQKQDELPPEMRQLSARVGPLRAAAKPRPAKKAPTKKTAAKKVSKK